MSLGRARIGKKALYLVECGDVLSQVATLCANISLGKLVRRHCDLRLMSKACARRHRGSRSLVSALPRVFVVKIVLGGSLTSTSFGNIYGWSASSANTWLHFPAVMSFSHFTSKSKMWRLVTQPPTPLLRWLPLRDVARSWRSSLLRDGKRSFA